MPERKMEGPGRKAMKRARRDSLEDGDSSSGEENAGPEAGAAEARPAHPLEEVDEEAEMNEGI